MYSRSPFITFLRKTSTLFITAVFVSVVVAGVMHVAPTVVHAQTGAVDTSGLETVQQTSGLGNENVSVTIGRVIRAVLGFLGILALGLVLYAGFLWMTAGGNDDQIAKAKKLLINASIGLLIILSSFAITQYVLNRLGDATGTTVDSGDGSGGGLGGVGGSGSGGIGSKKNFAVKAFAPTGSVPIYNVTAHVVFTEDVDQTSTKKGITVRKSGSEATVPITLTINGAHVIIHSEALCPDGTTKGCFEKNTQYIIEVASGSEGVKSASGKLITCGLGSSCSGTFTTGDAYDTKAPTGTIVSPLYGAKIAQGFETLVEASVNDDSGVSLVEFVVDGVVADAVAIAGGSSYPTVVSTNAWDTSTLALKSTHNISARVYDYDDHMTVTENVAVTIAAAHCFDGVKTEGTDELGVDCSPKGGECGQCKSSSCDTNSDCQSGLCAAPAGGGAKQCIEIPQITKITPVNGGFGQWVTIQGKYFGTSGTVYFVDSDKADTKIEAASVACPGGAAWTDHAIIVSVPAGLTDGKRYQIMVKNPSGTDTSEDAWGPKITNAFFFKQEMTPTPGLCSIVPGSEKPSQPVTLFGNKLGVSGQTVHFGNAQATVTGNPTENQLTATVPQLAATTVSVDVEVGGARSNPVPFMVMGLGGKAAPTVGSVTPNKGPSKQYITITGKNLGEFQNTVKFVKLDDNLVPTETSYLADFNFPAVCSNTGLWTDTAIVAKVPTAPVGKYQMVVIRTDADNDPANNESNPVLFEITSGSPTPGVCAVVPNNGPAKMPVSLYGEFFGNEKGAVTFTSNVQASVFSADWSSTRINTAVPSEAQTGGVYATTAGSVSNAVPFTVQNCTANAAVCGANQQCCGNGSCIPLGSSCSSYNVPQASYTFSFFTGTSDTDPNDFPPAVVEECSSGRLPSPTPWAKQQGGTNACANALVGVKFTIPIAQDSLVVNKGKESTVQLYQCNGQGTGDVACSSFAEAPVAIDPASVTYIPKADGDGTKDSVESYYSFAPSTQFQAGATYMAVLTTGITGAVNGMSMVPKGNCGNTPASDYGAYCFAFTIAQSGGSCTLGAVNISPAKLTVSSPDMIQPVTKYILDPVGIQTTDASGQKMTIHNPLTWNATGIAKESKCLIVNACGQGMQWSWASSAQDVAAPAPIPNVPACKQYVTGLSESKKVLNEKGAYVIAPAVITAKEGTSGLSDTSDVYITYGAPRILEQCGEGIQSPAPWSGRQGGQNACINAAVNLVFSHTMDSTSFTNSSISIEKCTGAGTQPCDTSEKIPSTFMVYTQDDTRSGVRAWPVASAGSSAAQMFAPNTWYRVGVSANLKSENGMGMQPLAGCRPDESYCFTFKTSAKPTACTAAAVEVTPTKYTATKLGVVSDKKGNPVTYQGKALADDACIVLAVPQDGWSWWAAPSWTPAVGSAAIYDVVSGNQYEHLVQAADAQHVWAKAQTPANTPADIYALLSDVMGSSALTIAVEPPRILEVGPSCTTVCSNADLNLSFTQEINTQTVTFGGTQNPASLVLLPCANESCLFDFKDGVLTKADEAKALSISVEKTSSGMVDTGSGAYYQMHINHPAFAPNTYYRVLVRVGTQGLRSTAGTPISLDTVPESSRYPKDNPQYYTWTFKTKGDGAPCAIASATVMPTQVTVNAPGIVKQFVAQAFGSPDTCNPTTGQKLDATNYDWKWHIATPQVANFVTGKTMSTVVYEQTSLCTNRCVAKGSQPMGTPACGNKHIENGEECDDGNLINGDGCSSVCIHEGTKPVSQGGTCGDGVVQKAQGEDCDGTPGCSKDACTTIGKSSGLSMCGNGDVGAGEECDGGPYCTKDCLWKGSDPDYTACNVYKQQYVGAKCTGITVCGNGITEPGEDTVCEQKAASAKSPKDIENFCNPNCTLKGGTPQKDKSALAYCGDGVLQPLLGEACDDGNNANGDGCSNVCLPEGSSAYYGVPSFCGDGQVGVGESATCEQIGGKTVAITTGKSQPVQYVVGLEGGPVTDNIRQTKITASVPNTKASGSATYAIQCGYTSETQCPNSTQYGLGSDSCCYPRPEAIIETASPNHDMNVCRNVQLSIEFSDKMDPASFTSSTVVVEFVAPDEEQCQAAQGSVVAYYTVDPHDPWYRRAWYHMVNAVRSWFDSAPAYASVQCAIDTTFTTADLQDLGEISKTRTKLFIAPKKALSPNAIYTVSIKKGIRNQKGITLKSEISGTTWSFQTGATICTLSGVDVVPDTYMFTHPGDAGMGSFVAAGYAKLQNKKFTITSTNDYSWSYAWKVVDSTRAQLQGATTGDAAHVVAGPTRGTTLLRAVAHVTTDTFNASSTAGSAFVGIAKLINANCEVPWPSSSGAVWSPFVDNTTHLSTWYCRGAAPESGKEPPPSLPTLTVNIVLDKTPGVLASYLLRNELNGDGIGIRVFDNPKHLSPLEWYREKFLTGSPKMTTFNGFDAVEDGTTVYVSAPNYPGNTTYDVLHNPTRAKRYTNIYVVSYNADASEETKNIHAQLLQNMDFLTNVSPVWDQGVCGYLGEASLFLTTTDAQGNAQEIPCSSNLECANAARKAKLSNPDSHSCLSLHAQLQRDMRRLADMNTISKALDDYSLQYGSYPRLTEGTYIPSMSVSTWQSWGEALGKTIGLGSSLPVDPLNAYRNGCADSDDGTDPTTCWNAKTSKYTCPARSSVYEYRATEGGASYRLKLPFESIDSFSWDQLWTGTNNSHFEDVQSTCFDTSVAVGGVCGDGILGANEDCEVGTVVGGTAASPVSAIACTYTKDGVNYPGKYVYQCPNTCTYLTSQELSSKKIACQPLGTCGDGVVNGGEVCDDGNLNGAYNHCSLHCDQQVSEAGMCGDGAVQKNQGEKCDVGGACLFFSNIACSVGCPTFLQTTDMGGGITRVSAMAGGSSLISADVPNDKVPVVGLVYGQPLPCVQGESVYNKNQTNSCNWDCLSPGPYCGDGIVQSQFGEQCDGPVEVGAHTASCPDGKVIRACNSSCVFGDESCVPDTSANGSTAAVQCGNGTKEIGEECDDGISNGAPCTALYGGTCPYCSLTCKNITLSGGQCGDGVRQLQEECDSTDLAGKSCADFGGKSGQQLKCSTTCSFDKSACSP